MHEHDESDEELAQRIGEVCARFEGLRAEASAEPGFADVVQGLGHILKTLEVPGSDARRARLHVLLQGLEGLADYLAAAAPRPGIEAATVGEPVNHAPTSERLATGLQQFVEVFRNEARRRLTGLSLSMMGIFNERASARALEQSAAHLHALRGGAAMLDLSAFAELAGTMEQVIVTLRKLEPSERVWPTRPLLRGYSLLEAAIARADARLDQEAGEAVVSELRQCLSQFVAPTRADALVQPARPTAQVVTDAPITKTSSSAATAEAAPIAKEENDATAAPEHELEVEQRVLIVDDIDTIAASVGFILSELDVPLDVARDGVAALEMLRKRPYSLVISDVAMPRMDGVKLTRAIRADAALARLPVILLTSLDSEPERQAGLDAGANDYLIKGAIGGGELVSRVRTLLEAAPFVVRTGGEVLRRILIAEDTETVAASIAFVLSEGPYDIVLAHDGEEALWRLRKQRFDLLITDVQMPGMSGFELVEATRTEPKLRNLPIVMLSSLASDEDRELARRVGANHYLVKGEVAGGRLLEVVQELLG